MEMKVHINEIKGKKVGYKIRWTEDGKPKEAFRKEYKQTAKRTPAPSLHKDSNQGVPTSPLRFYLRGE